MKNLLYLACGALFFVGCQDVVENSDQLIEAQTSSNSSLEEVHSATEFIVRYAPGIDEARKQEFRDANEVPEYETCECADDRLELWKYTEEQVRIIDIQGRKDGATDTLGDDGKTAFNNYTYSAPIASSLEWDIASVEEGAEKLSNANGTILAILDTGLDYAHDQLPSSYLTNVRSTGGSTTDIFGYDFVNKDINPADDYGHGTFVAGYAIQQLESQNASYSILPVKVLDQNGEGSLFDLMCGFQYANENGASVINLSLGYRGSESEIFTELVQESGALVVSAAGNKNNNNDLKAYWPANTDSYNHMSVLSMHGRKTRRANWSNYGKNSVTIGGIGTNVTSYMPANQIKTLSGTSFAAASVSAAGVLAYNGGASSPNLAIDCILSNSVYRRGLRGTTKSAKYYDHINSYVPCR